MQRKEEMTTAQLYNAIELERNETAAASMKYMNGIENNRVLHLWCNLLEWYVTKEEKG